MGWTLETLYIHFQKQFTEQEKQVNSALVAAEKAILKAEAANEKRFEGVNEFRAALSDQQRGFMPRIEAEKAIQTLHDKIEALETASLKRASQGVGQGQVIAWIITGIALLSTLVTLFFKFK